MSYTGLIDQLLDSQKKLAAMPVWQTDPHNEQRTGIKTAIEIEEEIRGKFSFVANAKLYMGNHMEIQLVLIYDDCPIERMALNPHEEHTNQFQNGIPKKLGTVLKS